MGLFDKFRKTGPSRPDPEEEREQREQPEEKTAQLSAQRGQRREKLALDGKEQPIFFMWLLFARRPDLPTAQRLQEALEKKVGPVKPLCTQGSRSFAVSRYISSFQDGEEPAQLLMLPPRPFDQEELSPQRRSQLWNISGGRGLLSRTRFVVTLGDMLSAMDYSKRCELLMDYMETAVDLFPDCLGVLFPTADKIFTAQQVREHQVPREDRFVHFAVNVRLFHMEGGEDKVVDSLGMYAVGLPDVQYRFHTLDTDPMVNHAYQLASYLFEHHVPIRDGGTVYGLKDGELAQNIQWRCHYENALMPPRREVLDVRPGSYTAGNHNP